MSEIKLPDNYCDIVVMASEPLKSCTPYTIRNMLTRYQSDNVIAVIMAVAANKTGWIEHDIDDPENDEETDARIKAEYDAWRTLTRTQGTSHVTSDIGLRYIIKPFMERNGFRDGAGWWINKG